MSVRSRRSLIIEARLADYYLRWVWPQHRKIVKDRLSVRCKRCILNEHCVEIDKDSGLCSYCSSDAPNQSDVRDYGSMQERMHELIQAGIRDNPHSPYHALLLFSGGKDSCYMALRLMREYPELRILCLSFDNTFMSPIAFDNINSSIERLGLAHMWVRPAAATMEKMFRFALLRNVPQEPMGLIDFIDGELISDAARTVAMRLRIPFIFMGLSPEQVERILGLSTFERPYEAEFAARTHVRDIPLQEIFDETERAWWWSGTDLTAPPARFLFPLYTWGVEGPEILREVAESKVLQSADLSPRLTNHALIMPMIVLDYIRHGYFTYEPEFAEMIRVGRARREDWISLFELMEYAAKTGKLLGSSFDQVLARLGLDRQTLNIP